MKHNVLIFIFQNTSLRHIFARIGTEKNFIEKNMVHKLYRDTISTRFYNFMSRKSVTFIVARFTRVWHIKDIHKIHRYAQP